MPVQMQEPSTVAKALEPHSIARAGLAAREMDTAEQPHGSDWLAFHLWIACFLLMMAMNWYDLLRALVTM